MEKSVDRFQDLTERYIKTTFDFDPRRAAMAGRHEYDLRQADLSGEAIRAHVSELRALRRELDALSFVDLDAEEGFDYRLLHSALDGEIFGWETEQEHRRNPMFYSRALEITGFLSRNYAPLDERVRAAIGHLESAPRVFAAARENLLPELPRPFIQVALQVYEGLLAFYRRELDATAGQLQSDDLRNYLERARVVAQDAVQQFIDDLQNRYLPRANDHFAIGADAFVRMLSTREMVDMPLSALLAVGERDLDRNRTAAREVARRIHPDLTPEEGFRLLKQDYPPADRLISETRAALEQIREFLVEKEVVSLPSDVRALVEPTPGFMRWAFAFMDTPGAFEEKATEAYYYVTPPDPDWPPEQQIEWLSTFNHYALQDISIHEAYPGHYVQYLHVKETARTPLRKLVESYAFIEGWAHYAEEMMLDAGYGERNPRLRLAQIQEALLRDCRYICAIRMHTQGMTVDEATRFFMDNAYMEEKPARQEALRGTFDPGYLNYTLGKLMLQKLRKDVEARRGINFNLRNFHDRILSYGSPPVPLLREAILGQGDLAIL